MLKKPVLFIVLSILLSFKLQVSQMDYKVSSGSIFFRSDAPLELIKAQSSELRGIFVAEKKQFAFIVIIKFFGFI